MKVANIKLFAQSRTSDFALIFGKGGYFGEVTAQLSSYFLKREVLGKSLLASDDWSNYFMDEGKFSYTRVGPDEVFAITADCETILYFSPLELAYPLTLRAIKTPKG